MQKLGPEKYERGVWLGLALSKATLELDRAEQGEQKGYENTQKIQKILEEHYQESKSKNALGYMQDSTLISALSLDVIPKTFDITRKNSKKYDFGDYLAGLELVLEQFQDVEHASKERLKFLRGFLIDLGNYRLARLKPPRYYFAA